MIPRVPIFVCVLTAAIAAFSSSACAFTVKDEGTEQLITRAEAARPPDRPGLYIEIAHRKADAADKLYNAGNAEGGKAALEDVLTYSQKATDSSITTGKKSKD